MNTRPSLATLWRDRMTVTVFRQEERPDGSTGFIDEVTVADAPCKLSFSTLAPVGETDNVMPVAQVLKVFCDKFIDVPAGARLTVTRDGTARNYQRSGEPGRFSSHQEIVLLPYKENA